jgi:hypothetical protein
MKPFMNFWVGLIILQATYYHSIGQTWNQADSVVLSGQTGRIDDQIEKSAEALEMDHDYSELAEELSDLAAKPVNINTAKEEQLDAIPFLSPGQRKNLSDYLATYGEVFSIYELRSIPGFDSALISQIRPFISISPPSHLPALTPKSLLRNGRHDLVLRYEQSFPKSIAYLDGDSARSLNPGSYYPGSPQQYYFRYNYSWFDKIRIGIAGEKDPGEQFFRGAQKNGMDFYSAYLSLSNIGILKNLTIGNFKASFGQGLTMGSGLSMGSVPGFPGNISTGNGLRPCLGMNESSYLRGLAATIKIKHVEISGFVSWHPRDATVCSIDTMSLVVEEISSFTGAGYHRTTLELAKRNTMSELLCGGNINLSMAPNQQLGFRIGFSALYNKYSASLVPEKYPYNQFGFHGNQNLVTGADVQIRYRGIYLFGEISRSLNGGMAWLGGATLTPDPKVCMTLLYRNYQPGFQNLFANAFGQNSLNANEQGIYAAINAAIHPRISLSGYFDLFTFPWLKYRADAPARGQEFGVMMGLQASGNAAINFRFYQKNTRNNSTAEPNQVTHKMCDNLTRSYRFGIEWLPANGILLKTRIEAKEACETGTVRLFGFLIYQDAQMKLSKWMESITLRFALFDIPGYASRIYVYEPEVLYGYSVPAYQGKGMRTCLVLKIGLARKVDCWFRGGITYYTDRQEVGTGPDLTEGNVRGELTGQLLIRL